METSLYANSTQRHGIAGHWWKPWTKREGNVSKKLETPPPLEALIIRRSWVLVMRPSPETGGFERYWAHSIAGKRLKRWLESSTARDHRILSPLASGQAETQVAVPVVLVLEACTAPVR